MTNDLTISGSHPLGERSAALPARIEEVLAVDSFAGKIEVRWAPGEAVTPLVQLPFFVDFLKVANLFDPFVAEAPLASASPTKPKVRDLVGTLLLSVQAGANPGLPDMSRMCSDDAVRPGIVRLDEQAAGQWLRRHLDHAVRPLLQEPWILDIDRSVKPVQGRQEGAEIGRNPLQPGRPWQVIPGDEISGTRLVLDAEVEAGNRNHALDSLPGWGGCGRVAAVGREAGAPGGGAAPSRE